MLARRCFFSKSASQRGISLRWGGRSDGVAPCIFKLDGVLGASRGDATGRRADREKLDAFEPLPWDHGNKLHFAEESNL